MTVIKMSLFVRKTRTDTMQEFEDEKIGNKTGHKRVSGNDDTRDVLFVSG